MVVVLRGAPDCEPPAPPFVLKPNALGPLEGGCCVNGGVFTGALRPPPPPLVELIVVVADCVLIADQLKGDDGPVVWTEFRLAWPSNPLLADELKASLLVVGASPIELDW